jgi:hypothetical protein
MPRQPRPSGCLLTLFGASMLGVAIYDFMNVDPEGDGGGTRFAALIVLGLIAYGCFRLVTWISRLMRREDRGFPIEPSPPRGEA